MDIIDLGSPRIWPICPKTSRIFVRSGSFPSLTLSIFQLVRAPITSYQDIVAQAEMLRHHFVVSKRTQMIFFHMFGVHIQTAWHAILLINDPAVRLSRLFRDLLLYLPDEQAKRRSIISQKRTLHPFTGLNVMHAIWHDDELMKHWLAESITWRPQ